MLPHPFDVYYEETKTELNRRLTYEYPCDERLRSETQGSTRLTYTGCHGGLDHLKIETRSRDESDSVFEL